MHRFTQIDNYFKMINEIHSQKAESSTNSIVLSFPPSLEEETFTRFAAVTELISIMNNSYKSEYQYDLFYFH